MKPVEAGDDYFRAETDRAAGPPDDTGDDSPPNAGAGGGDDGPPPDLIGPSLGAAGRSLDASALDTLEQRAGSLPDDPDAALAQLEQLAEQQLAHVDDQLDLAVPFAQADPLAQPASRPATFGAKLSAAPPDRALLEKQIRDAGQRELRELDAALQRQLADLDKTVDGDVRNVATSALRERQKTRRAEHDGDQELGKQIRTEAAGNAAAMQTEHDKNQEQVRISQGDVSTTGKGERDRQTEMAATMTANATAATAQQRQSVVATGANSTARLSGLPASAARQARGTMESITDIAKDTTRTIDAETNAVTDAIAKRSKANNLDLEQREAVHLDNVASQSKLADTHMQLQVDAAAKKMDTEREAFHQNAALAAGPAKTAMQAEREAAERRGAKVKEQTAETLRETHQHERRSVEARVERMVAELASTKTSDLGAHAKKVGTQLEALDQSDKTTETSMHENAAKAEKKFHRESVKRERRIRVQGAKARKAIRGFVAQSKAAIVAGNKGTKRELAKAGDAARKVIKNAGQEGEFDLAIRGGENDKNLAELNVDIANLGARATATAANANGVIKGLEGAVTGPIVDQAMTSIGNGLHPGTSSVQAGRALNILNGLPPQLQSDAVAKLDDAQFKALLTETTGQDRERLVGLVQNTTDPKRKLELWGAYHKAHAAMDLKRSEEGPGPLNLRDRDRRREAVKGTMDEVDEEMKYLQGKNGGFTADDVEILMQRKSRELGLEMKHAVNLTNQTTRRAAPNSELGEHVHWSDEDLQVMDQNLAQSPRDHIRDIAEFRRQDEYTDPDDGRRAGGTYTSKTKTVAITDVGIAKPFRLTDKKREHADEADRARNQRVDPLEEVSSHEIGHGVADANKAAFEEYSALHGAPRAVPSGEEYDYARESPDEMFAEHYTKAVHTPEQVHKDFVEGPRTRRLEAEEDLKDLEKERDQDLASKTPRFSAAKWKEIVDKEKVYVVKAKDEEEIRQKEFDIMRNKVFHTDTEQSAAVTRLQALGLAPNELEEFKKRAATASTPQQLRRIEADFYGARDVPREITITEEVKPPTINIDPKR